ncbi:MAG: polysaccharide pyruvyl transferase family protein [Terrisporobacter othiniensis]|nr:polysaccharide pyruvyl transferase family protein [Terrisporobacter othiniensis]MDU6996756.1 polysaccharide pyruvyl transferase family protein [Terrisporobacter othiniensis]
MKKIFIDIYLAFNLGDDLFLEMISKKYPQSEITVNYVGKNYDEFISKYNNIKRRRYTSTQKILQKLKIKNYLTNYEQISEEYNALVFIGGSIFREEKYHKSLYSDRMKMVESFNKKNKPVFVMGSNFGPYNTDEFFYNYKDFYKLCKDICFRDLYSYNLFKDLDNVRYAPDIVFQMDTKKYINNEKKNIIGYSIIDVRHKDGLSKYYEEYIESTIKSINLVVFEGYDCLLMSFCEKEGDLKVINDIKSQLNEEVLKKVRVYDYKGNLEEAITLISELKLFVAARFHANILGLLCNVGILPVIYSSKTTNMLKDINLDDILVDIDNLKELYNINLIEKAIENRVNLNKISIESKKQFIKLDKFIK